jgi:hypothetical protein
MKVTSLPPVAPPATTAFALYAPREGTSDPLSVNSVENSDSAIIGHNIGFYLQRLIPGAEGDPTDKGSKVEIHWVTGVAGTENLIARVYVQARSITYPYPDVHTTRNGTDMVGDGAYTKVRIKRYEMGSGNPEIDVELHGYLV